MSPTVDIRKCEFCGAVEGQMHDAVLHTRFAQIPEYHFFGRTNKDILDAIHQLERSIIMAVDKLTAAVTAESAAVDQAIALLGSANPDQPAIDALTTAIEAKTAALTAAITAATPPAPAPAA